jgi:predicted  nucleic acid-binding Zn-ribbon protein
MENVMSKRSGDLPDKLESHAKRFTGDRYRGLQQDLYAAAAAIRSLESSLEELKAEVVDVFTELVESQEDSLQSALEADSRPDDLETHFLPDLEYDEEFPDIKYSDPEPEPQIKKKWWKS